MIFINYSKDPGTLTLFVTVPFHWPQVSQGVGPGGQPLRSENSSRAPAEIRLVPGRRPNSSGWAHFLCVHPESDVSVVC